MLKKLVFVSILLLITISLFAQSASGGRSRRSAPASTYQLTVNANVSSYQVYIDGQAIKGNRATLKAGVYTVTVRANGYSEWQHSVNLTGNETITANLQPLRYRLSVNSNVSGADVYLNGSKVGTIP